MTSTRVKTQTLMLFDTTAARLRWQCPCGAAVSIAPATLAEHAFYCASCNQPWPAAGNGRSPIERLAKALHDLHAEPPSGGYQLQFEAPSEDGARGA